MAREEGSDNATESQKEEGQKTETNPEDTNAEKSSSPSSEDSDSEYSDYSSDDGGYEAEGEDEEFRKSLAYRRAVEESNAEYRQSILEALDSKRLKTKQEEQVRRIVYDEDRFNFPTDPEKWTEEDLRELWADAPVELKDPGWDPAFVDEEDWEFVQEELKAGRKPPIAPFYVPYRKPYPPIVKSHPDIKNPMAVVEELDRIEEFLKWVSYVFEDGSSYEGTVWDDLAHGRGVYVAEQGLVRYEGEWLQNDPEGHGVIEVDIPVIEPVPGSKLEAKMRKEGKILAMDYMTPEDREWLQMDIEDSYRLADGEYEIPFYENDEWVRQFGRKPEKGRYRYAGQWKHGRMHGCGVYEINERIVYGRFYFGELLDESEGCDEETTAVHAGIAEVAAAKARMFVNKPDGMVREERGPYGDPQHPYFYEGEDVWMAPGFINQFYEVPDYWKTYVHEVDQEREMWLNSFYKAPLRIPMPAELEYWWSNYETPEFILINKEPEPDPEDPSKLIYTEDPLILHTPTGLIINYVEDEEHGIRLFWQPNDEDVDPEKVQFLPLGFDEFFGREEIVKKESILMRLILAVENACKPVFDKLEKWAEEKKKACEAKKQAIDKEIELIEAELHLEEAIEDLDELLRREEKEEQEKVEMGLPDEEDTTAVTKHDEKAPFAEGEEEGEEEEEDEEEEEEEEEDDDLAQSSFGSVEQEQATGSQKGKKPGESPFSTSSLSFASTSLLSGVPIKLQQSFSLWKKGRSKPDLNPSSCFDLFINKKRADSVYFRPVFGQQGSLKAVGQSQWKLKARSHLDRSFRWVRSSSRFQSSLALGNSKSNLRKSRLRGGMWLHGLPERDLDSILSLQIPMYDY